MNGREGAYGAQQAVLEDGEGLALCRVLHLAPQRDASPGLDRFLEALGCRVDFCDDDVPFWEKLRLRPWDVVLLEGTPKDFRESFWAKIKAQRPDADVWLVHPSGEEGPPPADFVKVFDSEGSPEAFFRALSSRRLFRESSLSGGRVLLAHPDAAVCEELAEFLSAEGHRARSVRSAGEALAEAVREDYHMLVFDANLGDMDVWTAVERAHRAGPDSAVVVLADYETLDDVRQAMRADVFDYLLKPLDAFAFRRTLRKAMEKRALALQIRVLLNGLTRANRELSRLNRMRAKFLRTVTHDLRTPLTALKGYAQALREGLLKPEQYSFCFDTMVRESEQLEHLIGDLMDFVSIEAGKLRLEIQPLDPLPLLERIAQRFANLASLKRIAFSFEADGPLPVIAADARRLDQAVSNLAANAVKHTGPGGRIALSAAGRPGRAGEPEGMVLEVRVTDSGEGLSAEQKDKLFQEFFQVQGALGEKEGLGLGLVIVREIVDRLGGTTGVDSEGPGRGASFWFVLPAFGAGAR